MSAILATDDEPFRNRVEERLRAAGCDNLEVADVPAALADRLRDSDRTLVVVGGKWPAPHSFLRIAVDAGALPLVLLESSALEAEGEALAMGARAALRFDLPSATLAAALAAVDAGLIVLEPSARALLLSANRDQFAPGRGQSGATLSQFTGPSAVPGVPAVPGVAPVLKVFIPPEGSLPPEDATPRRSRRSLTARERQILSLVASGTSNKGIARALSVSANTIKFHLAAVFDKLNASTRAEAVAEAIRRGELSL